jgi:hypothetical protein
MPMRNVASTANRVECSAAGPDLQAQATGLVVDTALDPTRRS